MNDQPEGGFGLYVHWPFCEAKCPYCDFNSHVARSIDQGAWRSAYLSEIDRVAVETEGRILHSVFFGGGTPSLMSPDTTSAILDRVHERWIVANDFEVTLEANPSSVESDRFAAYRQAGVERVSIGIQALNDSDLKKLGRLHTATEARRAIEIAQHTFDRVSFDLIYARQDQSLQEWQAELADALSLGVDHLSLYQLTIEPGTAFADRYSKGGLKGLPDEDLAADLYAVTQDVCTNAGLPAYEISNHAKDMAQSQHNLIYWKGGDFLGIGPGAHGRITLGASRFATTTRAMPTEWLTDVFEQGTGEDQRHALAPTEHGEEYLMMGLRIVEGVDRKRLSAIDPTLLQPTRLDHLSELGLLEVTSENIRLTEKGRPLLNAVLRHLLT